jgi:hypothetical protein
MKPVLLLWAAALTAQAQDIPFGPNVLRTNRDADLIAASQYVELKRGGVTYSIADSGAPPVEIATPVVTVHPYFAGDYRIEVKQSGESTVTPLGGEVKVSVPGAVEWVPVGKRMIARDSPAGPEFRIVDAVSGWRQVANVLLIVAQNVNISSVAGAGGGSGAGGNGQKPPRPASGPPPVRHPSGADTRSGAGTRGSAGSPSHK